MFQTSLAELIREICYREGHNTLKYPPIISQIELTNACNLRCPMCPRTNHMTRNIEYMKFPLFKKIIDELSELNPRNGNQILRLHHFGESLLHHDVGKFIKYAEDKNMITAMSSNGVLLDKRGDELIENLSELYLSFDGISKEVYEKYRHGSNFEKTIEAIINFLNKKQDRKPKVIISTLITKDTISEKERFKSFWNSHDVDVRFKESHNWRGENDVSNFLKFKSPTIIAPCRYLWREITILADGRVVPCCMDYNGDYIIGDLNKENIRDIWNNQKYKEIRKLHSLEKKSSINLCKNCNFYPYASKSLLNYIFKNEFF